MQFQAQPARDFGAASVGEARQFGKAGNRHDAGNDGNTHAAPLHVIDKAEIGIGVVKILRDGGIGAGIDFAHEMVDVVFGTARLRVEFGIGGHFDVEIAAVLGFNQFHQFVGITHAVHAQADAGGDIAAQGDNVFHAHGFVLRQQGLHFVCGHADAGQVRRGGNAFGQDVADGLHSAFARAAACAGRAGKKRRVELAQLFAGDDLFGAAFGCAGGKEFKAERFGGHDGCPVGEFVLCVFLLL